MNEIYELARRHLIKVRSSGEDYVMAICPFHRKPDGRMESGPSFYLSTRTGRWGCFSCKQKGGLKDLLVEFGFNGEIVERQFGSLLEEVARHKPERFDPLRPERDDDPLPEAFLGLFDACPIDLLNQGFPMELLQQFDIGYDELHQRITFPIRDHEGRLMGINGRSTIQQGGRYKVYKDEYEAWGLPIRNTKKSRYLWNAHRWYKQVLPRNSPESAVILVEGYKACMRLAQHGFENVAALQGSSMSPHQQQVLERLGATVYLMLDNDPAGHAATREIAPVLNRSLNVRIVRYRQQQPSDLGRDEVFQALVGAEDSHLWAIQGAVL